MLAAGRSGFGGLMMCDAQMFFDTPCTNSSMRSNFLWTSELQHFDIGLSVGTYPWDAGTSTGGEAVNNITPSGLFIRVKDGIVVDGALNTNVQGNTLSTIPVETGNGCVLDAGVSADVSGGHASGTIQGPYTDRAFFKCVSHL